MALVVLTEATRGTAILGAKFLQAVVTAETRLAEADTLLALAVATAISRATGFAIILVEAFVTLALTLNTLAMAQAVVGASLNGTVPAVKALIARA
jgi:hypothetical protein